MSRRKKITIIIEHKQTNILSWSVKKDKILCKVLDELHHATLNLSLWCTHEMEKDREVSVCPTCGGNGEVISEICRKCGGGGRVRGKKDIKVKIPPGVSKGSILRVVGEGDAAPKGAPPEIFCYSRS